MSAILKWAMKKISTAISERSLYLSSTKGAAEVSSLVLQTESYFLYYIFMLRRLDINKA